MFGGRKNWMGGDQTTYGVCQSLLLSRFTVHIKRETEPERGEVQNQNLKKEKIKSKPSKLSLANFGVSFSIDLVFLINLFLLRLVFVQFFK